MRYQKVARRLLGRSETPVITKSQLISDLRQLGVLPGQTIMLHASVKRVGWIVGGADVLIQALLDVLTPTGTLMMYVSWEEWERYLAFGIDRQPEEERQAYLDECPPFDPATSRANRQWSILTEYLRTWPGACRSNHPTASVVAVGSKADELTRDHPLAYGYGQGSPFAKLCKVGGHVLLLGAPLNRVSLLHHAEHLADVPHKSVVHNKVPVVQNGQRVWIKCEQFDTCTGIGGRDAGTYFEMITRDYLASERGQAGTVGAAQSYLFSAQDLVGFAVQWLERRFGRAALTGGSSL
jgi:aminoglycoside 3-N-acetyltransferase